MIGFPPPVVLATAGGIFQEGLGVLRRTAFSSHWSASFETMEGRTDTNVDDKKFIDCLENGKAIRAAYSIYSPIGKYTWCTASSW